MITPKDIRNTKRKSGYDHVGVSHGGARIRPYSANWREGSTIVKLTQRATALEAAQDYCNKVNNGTVTPARLPAYSAPSIDMGNTTRHAPKPEKITIKRERFTGPHDLYDVILYTANGDVICRKCGITARGHGRYMDVCKTFGISIKPHAKAVTFPSYAAARVAEDKLKAKIARDPKWRRIGEESFAPVKEDA